MPGLKCIENILPSFEDANKILPLKPHERSVIPRLKMSKTTVKGLVMKGFHIDIVDSIEAKATTE